MGQRVLFVEGDAAVRAQVRRALEADGLVVEEAGTALEGLARAVAVPPDLLLCDVDLQDIDGCQLAACLRQEPSLARVPLVALCRRAAAHDVALAAGCDGFLSLPVDPGRIGAEVRAFLAGKHEDLPVDGERQGLRALSASMAQRLESAVSGESSARARLAESDRLRMAFMQNVAHEISTPLTPLVGYLKLLASDRLGALSPQQHKVAEAMTASVDRLARVVDNLSDFASLQAGRAAVTAAPVEPDPLVAAIVEELRPAIKEARLHIRVLPAGPGPVRADARKLRQALANLVSNAVKFSPHGAEVLVECSRAGGRFQVSVYDQGPGIAPADQLHVFEPFFHAGRDGEARIPGSGLGLPVARRIAEAHGGSVTVESPPRTQPATGGRHFTGTKVVLEIPA
jgi:signal transduction histidine kinase